MKNSFTKIAIVMMFLIATSNLCLARNGKGVCDGTGPVYDIYAGVNIIVEGEIISMGAGEGVLIATDDENVSVIGFGPVSYWDSLGIDRPVTGDTIIVDSYTVDYNGELRNIAVTVTIGGEVVELRDSETGIPLWR